MLPSLDTLVKRCSPICYAFGLPDHFCGGTGSGIEAARIHSYSLDQAVYDLGETISQKTIRDWCPWESMLFRSSWEEWAAKAICAITEGMGLTDFHGHHSRSKKDGKWLLKHCAIRFHFSFGRDRFRLWAGVSDWDSPPYSSSALSSSD